MVVRPANPRSTMKLKEIRELMLHKDWEHKDLAEAVGLSTNTVDRWFCVDERHRRQPSPEVEAKMREWLKESRAEVMNQPA